ncbi:MAG TPA: hypothetical protein DCX53_16470 [Anaerolineae bacterium]|nr:hypothetical protein [Anaerolineae bacterium]
MNNTPIFTRNFFRFLAAWVVLLLAIAACGGAAAPSDIAEEPAMTQQLLPDEVEEFPSEGEPEPSPMIAPPAILERRYLSIEYPPQMRAGDSDLVRLTLEVDDLGNVVPTAIFEGNVVTGEVVEIPNLYETHHVIAEAKFDIAGVEVSPSEVFSQTLSQGQSVTFLWSVRPAESGLYRGTIWFYLRFMDKVSGEESQKTISAQIVEIEAVNLFGLPANTVRTFGGVGSVVGAVIGFPFFEDIVRFIFSRYKRR